MSILLIIGIVFGFAVFHSTVVALLSNTFASIEAALCENCGKGTTYAIKRCGVYYEAAEPGDFHRQETIWQAIFWPFTLPYFLAKKNDPKYKIGKAAIDNYWENKRQSILENNIKELEDKVLTRSW